MADTNRALIKTHSALKLMMLAVLFFLILAQVSTDIPPLYSISTAVICLCYLWIRELFDKEKLESVNLELMLTQNQLKASEIEIIMSLILSQEAKDRYTHGHSERVTKYSVALAKELGLPDEEIDTINKAGKIHDIGKVGIRDDILFSGRALTSEEYEIIKTHPAKGANIIEPLKFLNKEKTIIRHHHERYDGQGYPDRLKGEEIPLASRIMSIADAFDAMKSTRPYKKPLMKDEIVAELKNNSGKQFDPNLVELFLKIINRFYD